jgi:hypothetical protein
VVQPSSLKELLKVTIINYLAPGLTQTLARPVTYTASTVPLLQQVQVLGLALS